MEAPPVQYATASDGVNIAWAEVGQGTPLLYCLPARFTHVQEQVATNEALYEALVRSFRLITFDARGTGMSKREVADVSAATLLMDTEAVIDAAKVDRFVVMADLCLLASSTALQLATAHPERVTHLVLESPHQNMRELADTPYGRAGLALAEADWTVYVQTITRVLMGFDAADSPWVTQLARTAAGWIDPNVGLQYTRLMEVIDVGDLLARVRQPTIVIRNDPSYVPAQCCQRVAAKIPGAQFRQFADPTRVQLVELVRAFVGTPSLLSPPDALTPRSRTAGAFRTILFTDLVGHTEMMQRLGDAKGRAVLREHERITRETLRQHGGAEVKTMGDGFLASFSSVTSAMECAIALQRAFAARNETDAEPLHVRVGLNAGEPIAEDGDLFGSTVILASRIAQKAGAGEILVPDTVRGLLSGKSFLFSDRGEFVPKGFDDTVRLYEVRWREEGAEPP